MVFRLAETHLERFLELVSAGREIVAIEPREQGLHLAVAPQWISGRHTLGEYRAIEPLKGLVFKPREALGSLMAADQTQPTRERIVIGAKGCNVSALRIHDFVFLDNTPVDPLYREARSKTLIISCDCTAPCDVCFCTAVNEQPFPRQGFDLNLSKVQHGYVVESGSAAGEKLCEAAKNVLHDADKSILEERVQARAAMTQRVVDLAAGKGLKAGLDYSKAIRKSVESRLWDGFAADCVECGACNFACCTCHCFLLADGASAGQPAARVKQWDSCLYLNFARVAGGANPRKHRAERLHNRFDKKFVFFPQVLGKPACDGCGRCIQACTGKIDIRSVLRKALDESESV